MVDSDDDEFTRMLESFPPLPHFESLSIPPMDNYVNPFEEIGHDPAREEVDIAAAFAVPMQTIPDNAPSAAQAMANTAIATPTMVHNPAIASNAPTPGIFDIPQPPVEADIVPNPAADDEAHPFWAMVNSSLSPTMADLVPECMIANNAYAPGVIDIAHSQGTHVLPIPTVPENAPTLAMAKTAPAQTMGSVVLNPAAADNAPPWLVVDIAHPPTSANDVSITPKVADKVPPSQAMDNTAPASTIVDNTLSPDMVDIALSQTMAKIFLTPQVADNAHGREIPNPAPTMANVVLMPATTSNAHVLEEVVPSPSKDVDEIPTIIQIVEPAMPSRTGLAIAAHSEMETKSKDLLGGKRKRGPMKQCDIDVGKQKATEPTRSSPSPAKIIGFSTQYKHIDGLRYETHFLNVNPGEDIAKKIILFLKDSPKSFSIICASGAVSKFCIRGRNGSIDTSLQTYEGLFTIVSLSGFFLAVNAGKEKRKMGSMDISLVFPDNRIMGGRVAGPLIAATPTQVIIGSFKTKKTLVFEGYIPPNKASTSVADEVGPDGAGPSPTTSWARRTKTLGLGADGAGPSISLARRTKKPGLAADGACPSVYQATPAAPGSSASGTGPNISQVTPTTPNSNAGEAGPSESQAAAKTLGSSAGRGRRAGPTKSRVTLQAPGSGAGGASPSISRAMPQENVLSTLTQEGCQINNSSDVGKMEENTSEYSDAWKEWTDPWA